MGMTLDLLNIVISVVGSLIAAYQVTLIRRAPTRGQRARLAGSGLAVGGLVLDRLTSLGQPLLDWRLLFTVVVIGLFAYSSYEFHKELPSIPRPPPPG